MIKKRSEQTLEIRENMRGGPGKVSIRHYFKSDEFSASCRLCAQLRLEPGAGIGLHQHDAEDEVFIIHQGRGLVSDNNRQYEVGSGDAILTGKGASHAIENIGEDDLLITAVIMKYK